MAALIKYNFLLLSVAVFVSCGAGHKELDRESFVYYMLSEQSRLSQQRVLSHVSYRCRLLPAELVVMQRHGQEVKSVGDFEKLKKRFEGQLKFTLVIEDEKGQDYNRVKETVFDEQKYAGMLAYANSQMQWDFELEVPGGERLPCRLVHMEAANSVDPVIRLSVVFDGVNETLKDYTLVYDDNLFNGGILKFRYDKELFEQLPQIRI